MWIALLVLFTIIIAVTGYRGDAREAATNYNKLLRQGSVDTPPAKQ